MIPHTNASLFARQNFSLVYYLWYLSNPTSSVNYLFYSKYILVTLAKYLYRIPKKKLYWSIGWNASLKLTSKPYALKSYPFFIVASKFARFMRRKLRRKYILKKLVRKFSKNKNLTRINFLRYTRLITSRIKPSLRSFSLKQRLFVSKKRMVRTVWNFLYTKVKNNFLKSPKKMYSEKRLVGKTRRKQRIFFNAHKYLAWKMRKARYAHWGLRTRGKLNEYRYNKLLGRELAYLTQWQTSHFLPVILLNTLACLISWRQFIKMGELHLIVYNGIDTNIPAQVKLGDIIELPFGQSLGRFRKTMRKYYRRIINRAKTVSYKSFIAFKRRKSFFRKHLNVPKIFKRLPIGLKRLGRNLAYDPALNIMSVIHPIQTNNYNISYSLTSTSVLGLQNWRYRFD